MKFKIEIDDTVKNDEIILKCSQVNDSVIKIQNYVLSLSAAQRIIFYKENEEFFISPQSVLFFETEKETVFAHTAENSFEVKYRLYELEKILPDYFVRISKSSIVNINKILSVTKNITSASLIKFSDSSKQVYASRLYFKNLQQKILKGDAF